MEISAATSDCIDARPPPPHHAEMRWLVVLLLGCTSDPAPVAEDAGLDAPPPACTGVTIDVPLGACCNDAVPLCADGAGVCVNAVCEPQCSGRWPICPGEAVYYDRADGQRVCYCRSPGAGRISRRAQ